MPNPNHPKKGDNIAVNPIMRIKDIEAIGKLLRDSPRDHLLFVLGINNGLRVCDLLNLKVRQVKNLKPGESISIKESKTGKMNVLMINKTVHKALRTYLESEQVADDAWLFPSRKGGDALQPQAVQKKIKAWAKAINLDGNYGCHTLRKTWGYIQRVKYGVGFEVLCRRYNHSSPAITMRYLGITDKEVNGILLHEIG